MTVSVRIPPSRRIAPLAALGVAFAAASAAAAPPALPAPLKALEAQGLTVVGPLDAPAGLTGYAAHAGGHPVALYVTPDGKHAIAGTLFDADGRDLTHDALERVVAKPMADAAWANLEKSHWIADGRDGAARIVYVFTDPNCPYCNKLWSDARPWVDAGKVQLRHVIVGILTPTSAGKAAALLSDPNPPAAFAAYERSHVAATAKTLATGHPKPLGEAGLKPLAPVPASLQAQIDANGALMASLGLQATPALVWRDANGALRTGQGEPSAGLATVFGPR